MSKSENKKGRTNNKNKTKFQKKFLADGKTPNPEYTDLLNEYPVISSQRWGCYSFISPEEHIKNKDLFMFEQFVSNWEYTKSVTLFSDFMHYLSFKYKLNLESIQTELKDFVSSEETALKKNNVVDDYESFKDINGEILTQKYQKDHDFQTSVRGYVNIGNFSTEEEARKYSKEIREKVPQHDILVGLNFLWVPLNPDVYKTGNMEYMEDELNQLHHEKEKNAKKAKDEFEQRKQQQKIKAIQENMNLANLTGNKLTQTMDENGNLIGVSQMVDFDNRDINPV